VEVERGDVALAPGAPITEALTVSAKDGAVRLEVPAGSRFELEAESVRSEVDLDVPELDVTLSDSGTRSRATGVMGGGGARVKLSADNDVTVAAGPTDLPAEQP
jgi:ferric-dicitrate binding protein FerR (iron transport regulator)